MISGQQVKIAIVDDHNLFRKGLVKLINAIGDKRYFILFEAKDGAEMIAQIDRKALPDIVIMDIEMRGMGGFEAVHWLRNNYPDILILVVSMIDSEDAIIRMLKLGVKGYLSKDIETEDLAAALKTLTQKGYYYTDFITGRLISSLQSAGHGEQAGDRPVFKPEVWHKLNEREREFINHACTEMTYEEIAGRMYLSPKTIEGYREAVFRKMNVRNRVGLVIAAIKHKLVTL